jgi:flagellar assembly protein FliH
LSSDDALLRGDDAERARPVDLGRLVLAGSALSRDLSPVGPWADEAARIREAARRHGLAQGLEEGRTQGLEEGLDEAARRCQGITGALDAAVAQLGQECEALGRRLADDTVQLALDIAKAVIGRELAVAADPGADAIARCLDLVPSVADLVVHLNPDDVARLQEFDVLGDRDLTVVPDDRLEPGDAVVVSDETMIDARIGTALQRVTEVLS